MTKNKKDKIKDGRPTKYKPEYCEQLINFFSGPRNELIEKAHITGKNEYEKTEYVRVACELPTFSKFARTICVNGDTIVEWAKKYKEFSAAYNTAKELQKEFLIDNGLAGLYPPASFIFTAKNITDMRDKNEIDHTSGGEKIMGINYIVPNENNLKTNAKATRGIPSVK